MLSSVAKRARAGGAARHRYAGRHGHGAVPTIQAVARMTRVPVVAVFTEEARCTPAISSAIGKGQTGSVVHTRCFVIHTLQSQRQLDEAEDHDE